MTAAARRQRLLRVRVIEQRIAAANLAKCERNCANVVAIADRLTGIRATMSRPAGPSDGVVMQSLAGLESRLEEAGFGVARALEESECQRARSLAAFRAADHAATRIERLHGTASRIEETERERRLAAATCPRRKSRSSS